MKAMATAKRGLNCGSAAGLPAPQIAVAVQATYKDFRKLVAYVLTDDPALAIKVVKQMGYFGLEWEADLVTLPPPPSE
jgi:hypothetical protein